MRSLADFIMRGRLQAAVLVLLGIPLLTPATIGLVTLRHGTREGALMVLVGLSPALLSLVLGRPVGVLFWGTLVTLVVVFVPALLLRATASWSFTLMAMMLGVAVSVPLAISQVESLNNSLQTMGQWIGEMMAGNQGSLSTLSTDSFAFLSGLLAFGSFFNGVTGLIMARWWQALLYNPGGFGEEFRSLRLHWLPSSFCLLAAVICSSRGVEYSFWASLFALPLVVVAIAIVHHTMVSRQINKAWLIGFYTATVFLSPMMILLTILGFADSWLNIRRLGKNDNQDLSR